MIAIFTSVIIPILNRKEMPSLALDCLLEQDGDFEVIIVTPYQAEALSFTWPDNPKVISLPNATKSGLLNRGAAAAGGDFLLFLWPDCQLPPTAITAIERNYQLLPQTIGGNFHVKFDEDSLFARLLVRFLEQWRYYGRYYGNSGIFIRKDAFEALGGFNTYEILEDYDLARRMERYGPTLYLPDTMIASAKKFGDQKLKAALMWGVVHMLFAFGLHPQRLARRYRDM